jgi:hypothetical protein
MIDRMNVLKEVYGRHAVEEATFIDPGGKPGTRTGCQAFACLHCRKAWL